MTRTLPFAVAIKILYEMLILHLIFLLSFLMLTKSEDDSSGSKTDETTAKKGISQVKEDALSWGAKKMRTARYEVSEANAKNVQLHPTGNPHEQSKRCDICRPHCPHWKSLSRSKRNTEGVRWHKKNQTKEQKIAYDARQRVIKKEWYANLTKVQKEEIRNRGVRLVIGTSAPKDQSIDYSLATQSDSRSLPSLPQDVEGPISLPVGWPQKKQRSKRFEISESTSPSSSSHESDGGSWNMTKELAKHKPKVDSKKQGKSCSIHRPGCDHWDDLDRTEKNKNAKRWQFFNMSKAEKENFRTRRREKYAMAGDEAKAARIERQRSQRSKKFLSMTKQEHEAFRITRNEYRRQLRLRKHLLYARIGGPVRKMKPRLKRG
ncbi:uncharacterized protein FA14DRAFT_156321 [Meira miltonrushii]|uniref:Uncharacterized protein n=1 Tax=Meira miltonrushii TaxID=1280837 RepID=A0A316VBK5_9BASI|nr:uncharacterized protein FA14DRAFT_156321 [Meira miltonrushii]PWN33633.1 hypothetical protein FA14DRAFT_156321 [Meira miltonrushii]